MSEPGPVWCVKENRGPWHGTASGYTRPDSETVIFSLCRQDVFCESGVRQQQRQPDCEKCLDILKHRARRDRAKAEDGKQRELF